MEKIILGSDPGGLELKTDFKEGFDPKTIDYLENAMKEVMKIEDEVFK